MFNENKFEKLSSINRLKKLAFSLRDSLLKRTHEHSYKQMIDWLNTNEAYRLSVPKTLQECQNLYEQIVERIYKEDPYQEKTLFDSPQATRTIFDITVILDNIRSPFNVGAFFRTSEALGVKELWLVGVSPNPDSNAKIARTAKGAIIPYLTFDSYKEVMDSLSPQANVIGIEKTTIQKSFKLRTLFHL
jgi:tRNA G18 (ribose-2'-O)-methylase SpoU